MNHLHTITIKPFNSFFKLISISAQIQKMGGWRKLWFVLQNQLLLSYSSKEDYEKKLAPFKDVLNLVPGTMVRPTKGPRFTIETSTNLIYTYVSIKAIQILLRPLWYDTDLTQISISHNLIYNNFHSAVIITKNAPNG